MNLDEYISSGIVENYVLGLADEAERAEFEEMCLLHPGVKNARIDFEESLLHYAIKNASTPPKDVLQSILDELDITAINSYPSPVLPITMETHSGNGNASAEVIPLNNRYKNLAVAAIVLLVASAALNFYYFGQYKSYNTLYTNLLASQTEMAKSKDVMQTKLLSYEKDLSLINDTNMLMIRMPASNVATSPSPSSIATVYWNKQSKDVYLHVNNMPHPVTGKQYQLWALVDGKPVDAGVFDVDERVITVKMKNIPRAQAFAVTLEKKGGSDSPTMDQLYILGKV